MTLVAASRAGTARAASSGRTVVATTTQVADLVRQVGGSRISVDGMLRPGGDPHDYEPRPSDVAAVAKADLVFRSGGEVDDWLGDVIDNAGGHAEVVSLIDSVHRIDDDPHWWQDPRNAERAVETIRARSPSSTRPGAARYRRNAARLERPAARARRADRRLRGARPAGQAQDRDDARRARLLRAPVRRAGSWAR